MVNFCVFQIRNVHVFAISASEQTQNASEYDLVQEKAPGNFIISVRNHSMHIDHIFIFHYAFNIDIQLVFTFLFNISTFKNYCRLYKSQDSIPIYYSTV